jgi:hypothetical protein
MSSRLVTIARSVDDFIIDRALQPGINLAEWTLGIAGYTVAKVCVVLGAGIGVIWLHRFDPFPSVEFYQDMLCLGIMVVATYIQIRVHEAREPRRPVFAPAARATGLLWRTAWLLDLAVFPFQWPVEGHSELAFNFVWTFLVVLPYWIICCRRPPPPVKREVGVFALATIPAR